MKIIVLDGYTLNPGDISWDPLANQGELIIFDRTPDAEAAERIGDAEAVFTGKVPITRQVIASCPRLKFIGVMSTGYNIIDIDAAKERGIPVANVPAYATQAVAQHVFALILAATNHVAEHSQSVRAGDWTSNPDWCYWNYPIIELMDKTMGIVGFGRIGQEVARLALAFRMNVLAFDEVRNPALESEHCRYAPLPELLAKSDIVSLHCPLFPSTQRIINKTSIAGMKTGAILINASRGPLLVEEDVRDALKTSKLSYAGVDVVSTESIEMDNPLLETENIYLTPHQAWAPVEARQRMMNILADNLRAYSAGHPVHIVN